ncbi:hypothetical protein [Anatilimnocola floriformis]|uniref:hypothetical protein n=1 Tax=Anatilimnocola floriformis TaxID=2948575 RepID=UPI0020C35B77|nr:hypothetical protein [Anatilimnocola floriformis]
MQTKMCFVLMGLCSVGLLGNAFGQERASERGRVAARPAIGEPTNPVTQLRVDKVAPSLKHDSRVIEYVENMLKDYDKNNDGALDSTEWKAARWNTPPETSDTNQDGKLDRDELLQRIAARFSLTAVSAPAAANEKSVARKLIHFEFVLIERGAGELGVDKHKTPSVEQLLQLEKDGKASQVQRLKLNALENVEARLQLGEDAPFVTGRTNRAGGGGFGGSQESVTYNSLGTTITLTAETESDGNVLASLNLARSTVAQPKAAEKIEGQEPTTNSYPRRVSGTIVTTVRIKPGEATLIGGQQTPTGASAGELWVIVTAKVD